MLAEEITKPHKTMKTLELFSTSYFLVNRSNSPLVTKDFTNGNGLKSQLTSGKFLKKNQQIFFQACDWLFGSVRDIFRYILGPLQVENST